MSRQGSTSLRGKVTERAVEKTAISKAWVIERLVENVERAMQAEPVKRKIADREEEVPTVASRRPSCHRIRSRRVSR
jgi:hypothetical protein